MGCRRSLPKQELLRLIRAPDGSVRADPPGREQGRGAYLCPRPECLERMVQGAPLARSFRAPVALSGETLDFIGEWQRSAFTR